MSADRPDLLSFESPEYEVKRLREENSRLRRLLTIHSIAIPEFLPTPTPAPYPEPAPPLDKEERACAWLRPIFRRTPRMSMSGTSARVTRARLFSPLLQAMACSNPSMIRSPSEGDFLARGLGFNVVFVARAISIFLVFVGVPCDQHGHQPLHRNPFGSRQVLLRVRSQQEHRDPRGASSKLPVVRLACLGPAKPTAVSSLRARCAASPRPTACRDAR